MVVAKIMDHTQIKIKMPKPSQEPTLSSMAQHEDLKDLDIICAFKVKIESQNSNHGCTKNLWPYPNQDKDTQSQLGTSSRLQSPNWGNKLDGCSLHL